MKIDDEARAFFSLPETLERLDEMDMAVEAFVKDLSERTLADLAARVGKLASDSWRFVENHKTHPLYIGLLNETEFRPPVRVEFGFVPSADWACFTEKVWIGIVVLPGTGNAKVAKTVAKRAANCFVEKQVEEGWAIFDSVKTWPNLQVDDYAFLGKLTQDGGSNVIDEITAKIEAIISALNSN